MHGMHGMYGKLIEKAEEMKKLAYKIASSNPVDVDDFEKLRDLSIDAGIYALQTATNARAKLREPGR